MIPLQGDPDNLFMDVYGDGSGNFLNARIVDAKGSEWQFTFGQIKHKGVWLRMIAPFDLTRGWPNQLIAGNSSNKTLTYPVKLRALIIDGIQDNVDQSGVVFIDNLRTGKLATSPNNPTAQPSPIPANSSLNVQITGQGYPTEVTPGQQFRPQVDVFVSSGQLLKTRGDMLRNTDGNLYGAYPQVAVEKAVNAGETYTFVFYKDNPITAPSAEGTYESRWRVWANGAYVGNEAVLRFTVRNPSAPVAPTISFGADRTSINADECITLRWDVDNVREIYLDGQGVEGHKSQKVCPKESQTYKLKIVRQDGGQEERSITIQVNGASVGICGQYIWLGNKEAMAFLPVNSNEPWLVEDFDSGQPIFEEGHYARIVDPEFDQSREGPQLGYPNVKVLFNLKEISAVSDCGATNNSSVPAQPGPTVDSGQLAQTIFNNLGQASVGTDYPQQAQQLVNTLLAHLGEFQLSNLGITNETMANALSAKEAGTRVNAIVQAVWGPWQERAHQGNFDANATDPSDADISPFRRLIIRLIQNRQGGLSDSEQHALYSLFTRGEEAHVWQDNMNAVIGAVNRESFNWP